MNVALSSLSFENGELLNTDDVRCGECVLYETTQGKTYDVTINQGPPIASVVPKGI